MVRAAVTASRHRYVLAAVILTCAAARASEAKTDQHTLSSVARHTNIAPDGRRGGREGAPSGTDPGAQRGTGGAAPARAQPAGHGGVTGEPRRHRMHQAEPAQHP